MSDDDNDGQIVFGDLVGLKLPDICLTGEEKPRKTLTQETYPDRGSNSGLLRDKRACYRLPHSGGRIIIKHSSAHRYQSLTVYFNVKQEDPLRFFSHVSANISPFD